MHTFLEDFTKDFELKKGTGISKVLTFSKTDGIMP